MKTSGRDVLIVGLGFHGASTLSRRLREWGFKCQVATDLRAAREFIELVPIDLVLTNVQLSDGTGLELAASLRGQQVTVFVWVPLEDSCLWLPALDCGKVCLGSPALLPLEFANSLENLAARLHPERQIS